MGETQRFNFKGMLKAMESMYMPVSSPLMVMLAKSELLNKYDLKSLWFLGTTVCHSARKSAMEVAMSNCSC